MTELESYPSLQAFGRQLEELADRDARRRSRRAWMPAPVWSGPRGKLGAVTRFAAAVGVIAAVAGGTFTVPVTRAAIDDVYDAFSSWFSTDDATAPGRAVVPGEHLPAWIAAEDGDKRILARAGGDEFVAIRHGDKLTLATPDYGTTGTIDDLRQSLDGQHITIAALGRFVPNGRHDTRALFGLVSRSITRVEFDYADGGPSVSADARVGAFGIVIETNRRPRSLSGYDRAGELVARLTFVADSRDLAPGQVLGDFRYCPDAATGGCLPWEK